MVAARAASIEPAGRSIALELQGLTGGSPGNAQRGGLQVDECTKAVVIIQVVPFVTRVALAV